MRYEQIKEEQAKKKIYHAVWTADKKADPNDDKSWSHVQSLDNKEDARDEADYQKRQGLRSKIVKQDW